MKNFITTTPEGTEGHNISYSQEKHCATKLLKELPYDWSVKIGYCGLPVMTADVKYVIEKQNKRVNIIYCQNLHIWQDQMIAEVSKRVAAYEKFNNNKIF